MKYYVRLVQGKGIISSLIEFKESDWPSHVEMVECEDDDCPIRVLSSRYPGGVAYRSYNQYPVKKDVWMESKIPSRDGLRPVWDEMTRLIGHKYDLLDILGIGFDSDWHHDGRYICSEAVDYSFEKNGMNLFNPSEAVRRITPQNFLLTPFLKRYKVVKWK